MPNLNLYIPDAEMALWDAARRVAKKHGVSLHRVAADALKADLERADAEGPLKPADEWSRIAADVA